ncbi:MAG: hypothetical protein QM775_33275 [Pirellulales bacterium]
MNVPMPEPLAFFLTWTTYGTRLPGDERGWVKRGHGLQPANGPLEESARESLRTSPSYFATQNEQSSMTSFENIAGFAAGRCTP